MTRFRRHMLAWGLLSVSATATVAPASATQTTPGGPAGRPASDSVALVFDHVTIVDVARGTLRPDQRVVVVGTRIRAIGRADSVLLLPRARVVNARGKYLIPGLWDMHLHLWMSPEEVGYPLLLANGVTSLRDPGSSIPLATLGEWKREIAAGQRVGPRLVVAGPSVFRCPMLPMALEHQYGVCLSQPTEARELVDSLKAAGADFLETYIDAKHIMQPETSFYALADAAREAGIPIGGHPSTIVGGVNASDRGLRFLNRRTYLIPDVCEDDQQALADTPLDKAVGDLEKCRAAAEKFRRNDTWIVLMPALPRFSYQWGQYRRYVPRVGSRWMELQGTDFDLETWFDVVGSIPARARPTTTAAWRAALRYVDTVTNAPMFVYGVGGKVKEAAGLPVVVGSDAVFAPSALLGLPGFSLHDALAMLVVEGMTPAAALRAATLNPALALHLADSLGTVEAGKLADLVLLDADPLAEINNTTTIRAVVTQGRYFDRAALDGLLRGAQARARREK